MSFNGEPQEPSSGREIASFFLEVVKIVIISLAIILPVRYYLVQPFFVKGASMEPSFEDGDYILVDELSYGFKDPSRGDVVIFKYPLDKSQFFIKRVIGLPGETIEIKGGQVMIYSTNKPEGFILKESYLDSTQKTLGTLRMRLDDEEYFVMGDNRIQSSDSRRWGALNRDLITGKAFIRPWPFDRAAKVTPVAYPTQ
ncbi:MAG TPA: signal peptidase I [Candidatus Paceibacterota bacterium]